MFACEWRRTAQGVFVLFFPELKYKMLVGGLKSDIFLEGLQDALNPAVVAAIDT